MVTELMGWDWLFSLMQYGPVWKQHRNLFFKHFPVNTTAFHPVQIKESHILLRSLFLKPKDFLSDTRRSAAAIILQITYGIQIDEKVDEDGDNYVSLADKAMFSFGRAGLFGSFMVVRIAMLSALNFEIYILLSLKGLPANTETYAPLDAGGLIQKIGPSKMRNGVASPCIVASELEDIISGRAPQENERILKNVAATSYAGGADTTVSVLVSLYLVMTLYPEIQNKAQRQLDQVLEGRLPVFEDRPQLPFIDCICYELLRWNPVTPLGLNHYAMNDDENYLDPKCLGNTPRSVSHFSCVFAESLSSERYDHHRDVYPDPFTFSPERFENVEKNIAQGINEIPGAVFGFGRRICPGRWMAFDSIWIAVASILSVYRISKAVDENGKVIEPEVGYTSSLLSHPKPFQCSITPRSAEAAKLVLQTADQD
ncbi:hypothetical protein D9758_000183 [Tetrapyrgos nigripes]|uniref:Cytochrome P450 n=1 Tax=Tetrapyrgos nigripes TaxID=182062 RepID=A0A8H5LZM6_9AGAR|nr:hypothetical protein D9758_000183 [Tetrapyrgos nigripes]